MKNRIIILFAILIIPWLTVPFLGKNALKKYLPAAILMAFVTKVLDSFGKKNKWWRFYKGITPFNSMNFFNFGPYIVTSLWILKFSYGKFQLYLITNMILHILFTFLGLEYLKRFKIASLSNYPNFNIQQLTS
ncbi:hypothetical protein [Neobacillus mesonae]|uniref:hypothetical protein n=1 Tax=Neobacillus mesonae TaxID=1193713 RepID=UPI002E1B820F|nr:hypothetical protein [Neobacillus mesonae]